MSHFRTLVLVRPEVEDVEAEVRKLLAPFNEEIDVERYKKFMSEEDIERMREFYKKEEGLQDDSLEALVPYLPGWHGEYGGVEEGHLFYWSTYNPLSKWDWYRIGGRWDGIKEDIECAICARNDMEAISHSYSKDHEQLHNNACFVHELPEDFSCYSIVTEHGWHEKGRMLMFGISVDEKDEWPKEMKQIFNDHENYIAVNVDCHI